MASQFVIYAAHVIPLVFLWLVTVAEVLPVEQYLPTCLHAHIVLEPCKELANLVYGPMTHCTQTFAVNNHLWRAPFYAVLLLGLYAVLSVIYGVTTFNDCSEARAELVKEIEDAKSDLKRRKVIST